jgi:hypothetical protein
MIAQRARVVFLNLLAGLAAFWAAYAADLFVLIGVTLFAIGLHQVYRPATWLFLGAVCIALGARGMQRPGPGA